MEIRKKLIEVALPLDAINGRHDRPTFLNVRRARRATAIRCPVFDGRRLTEIEGMTIEVSAKSGEDLRAA